MDAIIDEWQRDTDLVSPEIYREYLRDGDIRSLVSLEKLESGFERVIREIAETDIVDAPAVWSVYNMGYVVKTRESLFSIDLVHRRAVELADKLDFALITHNHGDHCSSELYSALNKAGKTVISNFLDNYGATGKGAKNPVGGGFVVGEKIFKIKDLEKRFYLFLFKSYFIINVIK